MTSPQHKGPPDPRDKTPEEVPPIPLPSDPVPGPIKTSIRVFGLGGAGLQTIARLVDEAIPGVDIYALSTSAQSLLAIPAPHKILLGMRLTRGLGTDAVPHFGEQAVLEAEGDLKIALGGADLVVIALGLGGGTGTGGAPIVAHIAREASRRGSVVVAVATLPFSSEGSIRRENASAGLERLRSAVDTLIVVPGDRILELLRVVPSQSAYRIADEILTRTIRGITEIITRPGLVNLDFNDLRTIMKGGGVALIGIGESESENRAEDAVLEAINSPLLRADIAGATGALINVTGGPDMTVSEAQKAAEVVQKAISPTARIIWGAAVDPTMGKSIRVFLLIMGINPQQLVGGGPGEPDIVR